MVSAIYEGQKNKHQSITIRDAYFFGNIHFYRRVNTLFERIFREFNRCGLLPGGIIFSIFVLEE